MCMSASDLRGPWRHHVLPFTHHLYAPRVFIHRDRLPAADAPRGHASIHDRRDDVLARHNGTVGEWHGLSAMPLSILYARRLAAGAELLVELAGMSELRQRRSVLASSPRKGETQPSR